MKKKKVSTQSAGGAQPQKNTFLGRVGDAIAGYLNLDTETNIVEAILQDHKALKGLLKILKDSEETVARKRVAYDQFRSLLVSHSEAEEKALYAISAHLRNLGQKTEEGFVEHDVALELVAKIKRPSSKTNTRHWQAQVQVLAELVEHHLEEEERDLLPQIRRKLDAKTMAASSKHFLRLRKKSQPKVTKRSAGVLAKS